MLIHMRSKLPNLVSIFSSEATDDSNLSHLSDTKELILILEPSTFAEAEEKCKTRGMQIVNIESKEAALQVFDAVTKWVSSTWVGTMNDNTRRYKDLGGDFVELSLTTDQPNPTSDNCMTISNDVDGNNCNSQMTFVCERKENEGESR
jgi:hypothetical protein